MSLTYSLEDIARTTDDMVVRRRFDQRNRFWLQVLLAFYGLLTIVITQQRSDSPLDVVISTVNLAFIASVWWAARDSYRQQPRALGRWLQTHVPATVLTYAVAQYLLLFGLTGGRNTFAWLMVFPWSLVALRLTLAEHVLLHAILTAGALMIPTFASPPFKHVSAFYVGIVVNNALPLAIEWFATSRLRRQLRRDWNERRANALEQIRMRDELRYARELQLSMLPQSAPSLGWVDLAAISIPATEVGGDYYDYFVEQDRVALVCGDVAGHGMASGLVLSALRSGFTLLRDSLADPASVLRRLHDLVAQTSRRRMLVTVVVVLLDRATRRITIASAGHPPVLVRRADRRVELIDLYAPPLGVRLPMSIPQRVLAMARGDIFILHSDGIYETLSATGDSYGLERLAAVVRSHDGSAAALRDAIIADVENFRGSELQNDDVTLVIAKIE